jgi:hypothetical protein
MVLPVLTLVAAGCAGFQGEIDSHGHKLPEPPEWSLEGHDSDPLPGRAEGVFISVRSRQEAQSLRIPLPGFMQNGTAVLHDLFYYRFFKNGRVVFSQLPVDLETAARIRRDDKRFDLPENIDFGDFPGYIGRYEVRQGHIRIELFAPAYARHNFLGGGAGTAYRLEEGDLTEAGFRITRISERHRSSSNDRAFDVSWDVIRTVAPKPLKDETNW